MPLPHLRVKSTIAFVTSILLIHYCLLNLYKHIFLTLLNTLVPLISLPNIIPLFLLAPSTHTSPWFTPALRKLKTTGHRLAHLYRKTGLNMHFIAYKDHIQRYKSALNTARSSYYSALITYASSHPKTLFFCSQQTHQPSCTCHE